MSSEGNHDLELGRSPVNIEEDDAAHTHTHTHVGYHKDVHHHASPGPGTDVQRQEEKINSQIHIIRRDWTVKQKHTVGWDFQGLSRAFLYMSEVSR